MLFTRASNFHNASYFTMHTLPSINAAILFTQYFILSRRISIHKQMFARAYLNSTITCHVPRSLTINFPLRSFLILMCMHSPLNAPSISNNVLFTQQQRAVPILTNFILVQLFTFSNANWLASAPSQKFSQVWWISHKPCNLDTSWQRSSKYPIILHRLQL